MLSLPGGLYNYWLPGETANRSCITFSIYYLMSNGAQFIRGQFTWGPLHQGGHFISSGLAMRLANTPRLSATAAMKTVSTSILFFFKFSLDQGQFRLLFSTSNCRVIFKSHLTFLPLSEKIRHASNSLTDISVSGIFLFCDLILIPPTYKLPDLLKL